MNPKELDIKELQNSTAYHEASHFVFAILNSMEDKNFGEPNGVIISVFEGKEYYPNCVSSSSPNFDETTKIDKKTKEQIFLSCFMMLSGFASNKVFFNRGIKNFIDSVELPAKGVLTKNTQVKYLSISNKLAYPDEVHDIDRTKNFLEKLIGQKYYSLDLFQKNEFENKLEFLVNQVCMIMDEEVIKDAIEIVKNELLTNNGNGIKQEDISILVTKFKIQFKDFNYTEYVINCFKALENNTWDIPFTDEGLSFKAG